MLMGACVLFIFCLFAGRPFLLRCNLVFPLEICPLKADPYALGCNSLSAGILSLTIIANLTVASHFLPV